jgi:hypothetical protein
LPAASKRPYTTVKTGTGRSLSEAPDAIKRVAKDYIPGYRRSKKITGNLIKKIALHREAQISQRKVLTVNTTAPGVISDCTDVIVMCPIISRKKSELLSGLSKHP